MKKFFATMICVFTLLLICSACSNESGEKEVSKKESTPKIRTIEELNDLSFYPKLSGSMLETNLTNFDFPIYDYPDITFWLAETNNTLWSSEIKNSDYQGIVEYVENNDEPYGAFFITGFYDQNNELYKEIKEKYGTLTYEETEETQSVHLVSSDGIYHRIFLYKNDGQLRKTKDELLSKMEYFMEFYEEGLAENTALPMHVLLSAREEFALNETEEVNRNIGFSVSGNSSILAVIPGEVTTDEASKAIEAFLQKITETLKGTVIYDEEKWIDHHITFNIEYEHNNIPIGTGNKEGLEIVWAFEEEDKEVVENTKENLSIDELYALADQQVEKFKKEMNPVDLQSGTEIAQKTNLDGDPEPEIVTLRIYPQVSELAVYEYNLSSGVWEMIYEDHSFEHYDRFELIGLMGMGEFTDDGRNQMVFGMISGSGGFLSFFVLGADEKGNVKRVLEKMDGEYANGELIADDLVTKEINIYSNGELVDTFTKEDFTF